MVSLKIYINMSSTEYFNRTTQLLLFYELMNIWKTTKFNVRLSWIHSIAIVSSYLYIEVSIFSIHSIVKFRVHVYDENVFFNNCTRIYLYNTFLDKKFSSFFHSIF